MRIFSSRRRVTLLAAFVFAGAFMMQLGSCFSMLLNTSVAAYDAGTLLDEDGLLLGVFAPCGQPNVRYLDASGVPGEVINSEDDLITDCPVTLITTGDG